MKIIKEIIKRYQEYPRLEKELSNWKADFNSCIEKASKVREELNELKAEQKVKQKSLELEEYWNNKRPHKLVTWKARNDIKIDVRCFFQIDETLPKFEGTNDEKASDVLAWTIMNIKYVSDKGEDWQFAFETLQRKKGDCEDGAILMSNILINSGVPYWRVRLNKGNVKFQDGSKGYHCFLTYLTEADNKWKMVDWCYWPEESRDLKLNWKDAEKYFEPDSSWNSKYAFGGLAK